MQGALRATLDRFSPGAIRARAEAGGFLYRILPGAREAALWQAYEREFGGVKRVGRGIHGRLRQEFRKAYEEQSQAKAARCLKDGAGCVLLTDWNAVSSSSPAAPPSRRSG
ncbi:type VI secretion system-associated FHA domain protein [Sphingomonas sp. MMS24-JH45]